MLCLFDDMKLLIIVVYNLFLFSDWQYFCFSCCWRHKHIKSLPTGIAIKVWEVKMVLKSTLQINFGVKLQSCLEVLEYIIHNRLIEHQIWKLIMTSNLNICFSNLINLSNTLQIYISAKTKYNPQLKIDSWFDGQLKCNLTNGKSKKVIFVLRISS